MKKTLNCKTLESFLSQKQSDGAIFELPSTQPDDTDDAMSMTSNRCECCIASAYIIGLTHPTTDDKG